jgi:glutamate racemase
MRPAIERVAGSHVQIIDSGKAIARRTHAVLVAEQTVRFVGPNRTQNGNVQVWCSGNPAAFSEVASKILGYPVIARQALL